MRASTYSHSWHRINYYPTEKTLGIIYVMSTCASSLKNKKCREGLGNLSPKPLFLWVYERSFTLFILL
uniref:Uncharacterized protein n=1 Tax=Enterococcus faecium TaxID=1352 RepID=A0A0D5MAS7_ENTFC|nr:hypothetical protein pEfm12493_109 [Enterococcus faecium]